MAKLGCVRRSGVTAGASAIEPMAGVVEWVVTTVNILLSGVTSGCGCASCGISDSTASVLGRVENGKPTGVIFFRSRGVCGRRKVLVCDERVGQKGSAAALAPLIQR